MKNILSESLKSLSFNSNLPSVPPSTLVYFVYNFLVTQPSFMTFRDFLWIFFLGLTFLRGFFQHSNWLLKCQYLFTDRCHFLCLSSVWIMNISLKILVTFESRWLKQNEAQKKCISEIDSYLSNVRKGHNKLGNCNNG